MYPPRNILVPTDFSEESDRAFGMALAIAGKGRCRIFLLHVISETVQQCAADYCLDKAIVDRVWNECIVYANEKLAETVERFRGSGAVKVIPDVRRGRPHEEILKEASQRKADLIVIASHGKTGLKKYFLGSVAERVMQEAACPVLLMRSQKKEEVPACIA